MHVCVCEWVEKVPISGKYAARYSSVIGLKREKEKHTQKWNTKANAHTHISLRLLLIITQFMTIPFNVDRDAMTHLNFQAFSFILLENVVVFCLCGSCKIPSYSFFPLAHSTVSLAFGLRNSFVCITHMSRKWESDAMLWHTHAYEWDAIFLRTTKNCRSIEAMRNIFSLLSFFFFFFFIWSEASNKNAFKTFFHWQ